MDWGIVAARKAAEAGGGQEPVNENWQKTNEREYHRQHHQKISALSVPQYQHATGQPKIGKVAKLSGECVHKIEVALEGLLRPTNW